VSSPPRGQAETRFDARAVFAGQSARWSASRGRQGSDTDPAFLRASATGCSNALAVSIPLGGAGLGLAVCKEIIEAHGGQIWIDDADGGGREVWITLPAQPSEPEPSPEPQERRDAKRRERQPTN
jgi:light-regulated signal transduction histidine kinase (bacteriophytochrome)